MHQKGCRARYHYTKEGKRRSINVKKQDGKEELMPDFKKTRRWSYQPGFIFFLASLCVNDYIGHFPTFKVAAFGMIPLFLTMEGLLVYGFWKGSKCSAPWGRRKLIRLEIEASIILAVATVFSELYLLGIAVWTVSILLFTLLLKKYGSHDTTFE